MNKTNIILKQRQVGFEILRIFAIFLICCVHVMNYGGMLKNAQTGQEWQKLIYAFFTPSVNIFVLISGYFMLSRKFKLSKLIDLWVKVFLFTIISYLINALIIEKNFQVMELVKCFFPIITKKYWFFSTYFLLYLFSPFLNKILNNSSKKSLTYLMIGLLIITYLSMHFNIGSVISIGTGYTLIWFCILYLIGGYLSKYPIKINKWWSLLIYSICIFGLWGFSFIKESNMWLNLIYNSLDYPSILVLIASICLILIAKDIKINNQKISYIICFIAKASFGIYLFQESAIKPYLYFKILKINTYYDKSFSFLYVLLFGLLIWLFGLIVDLVISFIWTLIRKLYENKLIKQPQQEEGIINNEN